MTVVDFETVSSAPQNLEAEESVLGACLLGNPATYFAVIETGLRGSDFYRESHAIVFRAIGKLAAEGVSPDIITVVDALEGDLLDDGQSALAAAGGKAKLAELAALVPAASNAPHYANIVREQALRRGLLRATQEATNAAQRGAAFDEIVDVYETKVEAIRSRSSVRKDVHSGVDLATRFHEKRLNPPTEDEEGVTTSRIFFRRPLRRGALVTIAGYTGDGKTAAALNLLAGACREGNRVGYASLEMSGDEVFERLVASYGVPYEQAQTGRIEERFVHLAERAESEIAGWNYDVFDNEEVDPISIRRWAVAGKYDIVFIDHLHRIEFEDRFQIEKTVRSFRNMARRLDVPVVMLAQLNRTGDKKNPYPPPTLSSLRETAVIEHESALVGFVYRERDEDDPNRALPSSRFIVAKNRFGGTGVRSLFFDGDKQTFREIARGG